MHLGHYLDLAVTSEQALATAFRAVAQAHGDDPELAMIAARFASECQAAAAGISASRGRYETEGERPERLHQPVFHGTRSGPLALLRDLHDLYLLCQECGVALTVIDQGAQGARDRELHTKVTPMLERNKLQTMWVLSRIKRAAPQLLLATRD